MSARNYVASPVRFMEAARPALPLESRAFEDASERFLVLEARWEAAKGERDAARRRGDPVRVAELDHVLAAIERETDEARSAFTHMRRHG